MISFESAHKIKSYQKNVCLDLVAIIMRLLKYISIHYQALNSVGEALDLRCMPWQLEMGSQSS